MATTTNYGWTTPDDTNLVKDGAAAIRTLGSSIDTTTKNLNPETTLGDIAYRSSTANVKTRLGIGSTGQVLTVSGGVPTWATPAGGATFVGASAYHSTTFTVNGYANTVVPLNSENFDSNGFHDNTTNNSRMTVPTGRAGKYVYNYQIKWANFVNGAFLRCQVFKNGSNVMETRLGADGDGGSAAMFNNSVLLDLAAGDYVELYLFHQTGTTTFSVPQTEGFVQLYFVGA